MFPFSIKYKRRLTVEVSAGETDIIMAYIEKFIRKKSGEAIVIDGNQLTFKSTFFNMRWNTNILVPIEKGKFDLIGKGNECILVYEFFMYQIFLIVFIMSIVMGIVSSEFWFGIICFAWLGGMNWIIAIIRHRMMLGDIVNGIEILIMEKKGSR